MRREIRALQREATWLQKALFALGKVEEAREAAAELNDEEATPLMVVVEDGPGLPLEAVEEALETRVKELLEVVRERRRILR